MRNLHFMIGQGTVITAHDKISRTNESPVSDGKGTVVRLYKHEGLQSACNELCFT